MYLFLLLGLTTENLVSHLSQYLERFGMAEPQEGQVPSGFLFGLSEFVADAAQEREQNLGLAVNR